MIEKIEHSGITIAIIIRHSYSQDGVSFFTPHDYSQQLAFMKHPKGKVIQAHTHNPVNRSITKTQEVLVIKKGVLRVDLYNDDQVYLESKTLHAGDVILLAHGGHGFEVLEPIEMVEVKQGPYSGELDKTCFDGYTVTHKNACMEQ